MSMHNVRFQFKVGSGTNYKLLCEVDDATADPKISKMSFLNELAVGNYLRKSGLEWNNEVSPMMFGRWFYVSDKQLQRLGFAT